MRSAHLVELSRTEDVHDQVAHEGDMTDRRSFDCGQAPALEEMAFLNITLNVRNGWSWQSGWKLAEPSA
ncbi:hypothetical protein ACFOWZ_27540 [Lentzea rhizosphaerae]|uniref:Tn3 transposase DDE domain-containing protein n=1 Tax=Lentzea rhizosphaerae TaxID=2041025 RepID=A0ABV8BZS1_9PSEU